MKKAVIVFSGGMDSTTALYQAVEDGYKVYAISFDYGQKHKKELEHAEKICLIKKVDHKIVDLTNITSLISNSALTSDIEVPEGDYKEDNMKITVVPNRNMIMASIAVGYAVNIKAEAVYLGVHGGDHFVYPDCRPHFIEALNLVSYLGNEGFCKKSFRIITPFMYETKKDIVKTGVKLNVPYELTWSCYKGGEKHCGKCGTCVERKEAFTLAKVKDPTKYEN